VCSRKDCSFGPVAENRGMATYCGTLCRGMTDGYMQCEPTLLTARLVDIGEEGLQRVAGRLPRQLGALCMAHRDIGRLTVTPGNA